MKIQNRVFDDCPGLRDLGSSVEQLMALWLFVRWWEHPKVGYVQLKWLCEYKKPLNLIIQIRGFHDYEMTEK